MEPQRYLPPLLRIVILFLAVGVPELFGDIPTPKDIFSTRIESEKWVHAHLLKGMTREEILQLVGKPSFEDTGSTGDWIMSYLLKDPPNHTTVLDAYGGFEIALRNNKVIRVDSVVRSVLPSENQK